ncbi:MAG: NfeD family protein [Coriobacteriales bacterium]|jgi:membrane protein implicated in regulation of membrane protease activity|nr:NfeD family protein [Coriobacteriales bacterium]
MPWFWIWVVLAAALYIGEMLTVTFFMLPFAVGATVAAISAALAAPVWLQWLLFVLVSVLALVLLRPVARRVTKNQPERSGVDRLLGMTGHIIEGNAPSGEARARVDREIWNVTVEDDAQLAVGQHVKVIRVDGTHLVVRPVS